MIPKRLKPRVAFGMQFEYSHDYDQQGVIYWISTNGGKESPQNPHLANRFDFFLTSFFKKLFD